MSAFQVSNGHIDRLVALALYGPKERSSRYAGGDIGWYPPSWMRHNQHRSVDDRSADSVGQMLADTNLRSIHARYPDTVDGENVPGSIFEEWRVPYEFPVTTERVTALEGLLAIDCYEYQACEFDEWPQSEAQSFCHSLRDCLCSSLIPEGSRGWDDWDRRGAAS
jgi:hypothetical protein